MQQADKNIETRLITPEQTRPLRHLVLWPHIAKEEDCVIDIDHRDDAFHLGVFVDGELKCIGSFFAMQSDKIPFSKQYRLRAMATHPDWHGRGLARQLILHALDILKNKEQDILWCDARLKAVGFYERLGFSQIDEVYEVPKIGPHKFMWKEI